MKKIFSAVILVLLNCMPVYADSESTITSNLMGLGVSGQVASYIADQITGGAIINSPLESATSLQIKVDSDAQRLFTYDASSDTALFQSFGDAGTTAGQVYSIRASTADADDDSALCLAGGGACAIGSGGYTQGAVIVLNGNEKSGDTGTLYIQGGGVSGADVFIRSEDDIVLETTTGTDALVIDTATGNATLPLGDVILSTSGKTVSIQENSASTACLGVTTPNGTTPVTVTTSCAVSGARIFYSRNGAVTNVGVVTTTTAPNGTSFAFASTNASDTTTSVVWWIIKEAS